MDISVAYRIMTFFDNIDDLLNNFIDAVELTPVQINKNLYITGFRRSQYNYTTIDVHLKEIRKIKLPNLHTSITDEGGWYMMEPDGEMWVNSTVLEEKVLEKVLNSFIETYGNLKTLHLMTSKWKDDGDSFTHIDITLYENKRVACKEALNMRKKHKNVSNTFEAYSNTGELIGSPTTTEAKKEPSDFELITAKAE